MMNVVFLISIMLVEFLWIVHKDGKKQLSLLFKSRNKKFRKRNNRQQLLLNSNYKLNKLNRLKRKKQRQQRKKSKKKKLQ